MPNSMAESTGEPETNLSVSQQQEQSDALDDEVIADYVLDINYEPDGVRT